MNARLAHPSLRNHILQKSRIAELRTLYISVHDDPSSVDIFLRVKRTDYTSETIALYDIIAYLTRVALQYGAFLEKIGELITAAKFFPCRFVSGHDRLRHCSSLFNLISLHFSVEYCSRYELAHVPRALAEVSEYQEAQP